MTLTNKQRETAIDLASEIAIQASPLVLVIAGCLLI